MSWSFFFFFFSVSLQNTGNNFSLHNSCHQTLHQNLLVATPHQVCWKRGRENSALRQILGFWKDIPVCLRACLCVCVIACVLVHVSVPVYEGVCVYIAICRKISSLSFWSFSSQVSVVFFFIHLYGFYYIFIKFQAFHFFYVLFSLQIFSDKHVHPV